MTNQTANIISNLSCKILRLLTCELSQSTKVPVVQIYLLNEEINGSKRHDNWTWSEMDNSVPLDELSKHKEFTKYERILLYNIMELNRGTDQKWFCGTFAQYDMQTRKYNSQWGKGSRTINIPLITRAFDLSKFNYGGEIRYQTLFLKISTGSSWDNL